MSTIQRRVHVSDLRRIDRAGIEQAVRDAVQTVYLGNGVVLSRVLGSCKIYLHTNDVGFAGNLMLDGFWEGWLTRFIASRIKPGMTVIDVGANYGYYTLLMGGLLGGEGHVVAVEPNPAVLSLLRKTFALNGLSGMGTLLEAAAGKSDNVLLTFAAPPGEPKNGMVFPGPDVVPSGWHTEQIPAVRLDTALADHESIDFVKIDAEGAEVDIIEGFEARLARDRPEMVLEFNTVRYSDADGFLGRLLDIYGSVQEVGYDGCVAAVTPETILNDRSGEDRLLVFGYRK